jgi:hypothetical protein
MNQHGLYPVTASPPPSGLAVASRACNRLFYENIPFCLSGAQPDFFCRASSDLTIAFVDIRMSVRSARRRASATATWSNGSEHIPSASTRLIVAFLYVLPLIVVKSSTRASEKIASVAAQFFTHRDSGAFLPPSATPNELDRREAILK